MSHKHLQAEKSELEIKKDNQSKVVVNQHSISCPDILKSLKNAHHIEQKHPRVMIELNENNEGVCYYCGTVFIYQPK